MSLPEYARARLDQVKASGRWRVRQTWHGANGVESRLADETLKVFCSNDYLGLAQHPQLRTAWSRAAENYGVGSTASQYINGHSAEIAEFEQELAAWLGYPRVLLLGSGYLANTGVIDALVGRNDQIFSDALNHASIIDGCRLSGASITPYPHANLQALAESLELADLNGHRLVVSDAVFSMDGDIVPVSALAKCCARHDAWLMLDDAHGLGVLGPQGRGAIAAAGCGVKEVPVMTGTLGKSFGVYGAFVAAEHDVIEMLIQSVRTGIFATALPPALVAALRASLELVKGADDRRRHLHALIKRFRQGLLAAGMPDTGSDTPIQPILVGSEARAMALSAALRQRGFWVSAIRPPTVPQGTCRLRVTLSAAHSEQDVEELLQALGDCWSALDT